MSIAFLVNFLFLMRSKSFQNILLLVNDSLNHHLFEVYLSRVVGNLGTLACIIATLYTTLCVEYILPYFSYMFDVPRCRHFLQTTLTLTTKVHTQFLLRISSKKYSRVVVVCIHFVSWETLISLEMCAKLHLLD